MAAIYKLGARTLAFRPSQGHNLLEGNFLHVSDVKDCHIGSCGILLQQVFLHFCLLTRFEMMTRVELLIIVYLRWPDTDRKRPNIVYILCIICVICILYAYYGQILIVRHQKMYIRGRAHIT